MGSISKIIDNFILFIFSVGHPIDVKKTDNPSSEQIDKLHKFYIEELIALFEKHKLDCGLKHDDHLIIE